MLGLFGNRGSEFTFALHSIRWGSFPLSSFSYSHAMQGT